MSSKKEQNDDVLEGELCCTACKNRYPIRQGIAIVVPRKTMAYVTGKTGYNSINMLSSYLWSHFSEFFNGQNATDAYKTWASYFQQTSGWALDIGCSVGRLSFELSKTHAAVIGVDSSFSFIKKARELLIRQHLQFDMIIEGHITEERSCKLDESYNFDQVEFIVADAMALPFCPNFFSTAVSVNILEKVPDPIQHLMEINRVLQKNEAQFLFSDPFSWDEAVSDPKLWLSGRNKGEFKGRGIDNICRLFQGQADLFNPPFDIKEKGDILWKIRKTANLWEHITSQFILGKRSLSL